MSTNNQYKLPSEIENRYDLEFSIMSPSDEEIKQFIATEQVTLLKWMLGEIGEDEELVEPMCTLGGMQYNRDVTNRNNVRAELRAKVQAKLEEYKV